VKESVGLAVQDEGSNPSSSTKYRIIYIVNNKKRNKMKNTIFAIAIMSAMISFTSCTSNDSNSEAAATTATDSTSVVDSTSHTADSAATSVYTVTAAETK